MADAVKRLARFRADPSRVRVSVRRWHDSGIWIAKVESRDGARCFTARSSAPSNAVTLALEEAEEAGLPGIDLGMGWAYEHPMGPEVKRGELVPVPDPRVAAAMEELNAQKHGGRVS